MAGRPKAFDPEETLEKAVDLFWLQGYEATGLKQLLTHMGIGYQSLYDTYGNKHDVFVKALKQYDAFTRQRLQQHLEAPGSALQNIHQVIQSWEERATEPGFRGCFISLSIAELGLHDPEVAAITRRHLESTEALFFDTLERARAAGELTTETPSRALARYLVHTVRGLEVLGKAGMDKEVIQDIIKIVRATVT